MIGYQSGPTYADPIYALGWGVWSKIRVVSFEGPYALRGLWMQAPEYNVEYVVEAEPLKKAFIDYLTRRMEVVSEMKADDRGLWSILEWSAKKIGKKSLQDAKHKGRVKKAGYWWVWEDPSYGDNPITIREAVEACNIILMVHYQRDKWENWSNWLENRIRGQDPRGPVLDKYGYLPKYPVPNVLWSRRSRWIDSLVNTRRVHSVQVYSGDAVYGDLECRDAICERDGIRPENRPVRGDSIPKVLQPWGDD